MRQTLTMANKIPKHKLLIFETVLKKHHGKLLGCGKQILCTVPLGSEDRLISDLKAEGFFLADDEGGVLCFSTDSGDADLLELKKSKESEVESLSFGNDPDVLSYAKYRSLFTPFLPPVFIWLIISRGFQQFPTMGQLIFLGIITFIGLFFGLEYVVIGNEKIILLNWQTKFIKKEFGLNQTKKIYFTDETDDDSRKKISCTVEFLADKRYGFNISLKEKALVKRLLKRVG